MLLSPALYDIQHTHLLAGSMFSWDRLRAFTWAISQQNFLTRTRPESPVSTKRPEDEPNALHAVHYYEQWHGNNTVRGAVGMQCVSAHGLTLFLSCMAHPQQGNQGGNVLCNNSFTLCHDWGVQKWSSSKHGRVCCIDLGIAALKLSVKGFAGPCFCCSEWMRRFFFYLRVCFPKGKTKQFFVCWNLVP